MKCDFTNNSITKAKLVSSSVKCILFHLSLLRNTHTHAHTYKNTHTYIHTDINRIGAKTTAVHTSQYLISISFSTHSPWIQCTAGRSRWSDFHRKCILVFVQLQNGTLTATQCLQRLGGEVQDMFVPSLPLTFSRPSVACSFLSVIWF